MIKFLARFKFVKRMVVRHYRKHGFCWRAGCDHTRRFHDPACWVGDCRCPDFVEPPEENLL